MEKRSKHDYVTSIFYPCLKLGDKNNVIVLVFQVVFPQDKKGSYNGVAELRLTVKYCEGKYFGKEYEKKAYTVFQTVTLLKANPTEWILKLCQGNTLKHDCARLGCVVSYDLDKQLEIISIIKPEEFLKG